MISKSTLASNNETIDFVSHVLKWFDSSSIFEFLELRPRKDYLDSEHMRSMRNTMNVK